MLLPKRVKHRKQHRGRMTGVATRGNKVTYGEYGLQTTEPAWITAAQIEAARIAMTRYTKRGGKVWIKIFPDKPITARPADTRMGKGKGNVDYWVAVVKPGRVMFELGGVDAGGRQRQRLGERVLAVGAGVLDGQQPDVGGAHKTERLGDLVHGAAHTPCAGAAREQQQTDPADEAGADGQRRL